MKKFSALPKKSMAVISLILTLALMLGSVVAVPASAEETATVTSGVWSALKNVAGQVASEEVTTTDPDTGEETTSTVTVAKADDAREVNPEFTYGIFSTGSHYKTFDSAWTAPTIGLIDSGLSAKWSAYEGAASYVLNFYNDSLVPTASVATTELNAATTELSFGETYNVQIDALDSTGKVMASSIPRKYDYIAYTFFNAADYVPATEEKEASHNITYNDRIDGNVNPNPAEVIDLEAAPNGKALVTGDMQNFYYSNHKVNGIELSELDAVAIWIGQSGFTVGNTTYYPDYSTYSITLDGYAEDNDTRVGSYAGTKSSSVKICTECGTQNASDATACTACEGTLTSCATQYFIPTDGNEVGYAADTLKIRHNNSFNNPHIAYTVGGYYVFSLDKLTAEEKTVLLDSLSNGYKFGCSFNRGSLAYRYKADGTWTKLTTTAASEIEGFDTATADNKIYISNMMIISDMDKFLTNNGITPVTVTKSTQYKLTDEVYAPAETAEVTAPETNETEWVADAEPVHDFKEGQSTVVTTLKNENADAYYYYSSASKVSVNYRGGYINGRLTSNQGLKLGFTAPSNGTYVFTNSLNKSSDDATVSYRVVKESNGIRTTLTDINTIVGTDTAVRDFGNVTVTLNVGEKVWLEAWADDTTTINFNNPTVNAIAVTEDVDTSVKAYAFEEFNILASNGNTASRHAYKTNNNSPWKMEYITPTTETVTNDDETTSTVITDITKTDANILTSGSNYIYSSSLNKHSYFRLDTLANDKQLTSSAYFGANTGISYTFVMPEDGDLALDDLVYAYTMQERLLVNGEVVSDWAATGNNMSYYSLTDLKSGDVVEYQVVRLGNATTRSSAPVATVTSYKDFVYGDSNNDGTFNLVDLVQLKKAAAEIGEVVRMKAVNIDGDEASYATDLTVMRRALIKAETYEAYLERITAESGTSTPEVA